MNAGARPGALPSGLATFLFTDIEGSTRRWETDADGMRVALTAHDDVLRTAIEAHGGWPFKHTGDGVCAAFASPSYAVDARTAIPHHAGWAGPNTAAAQQVQPLIEPTRLGVECASHAVV